MRRIILEGLLKLSLQEKDSSIQREYLSSIVRVSDLLPAIDDNGAIKEVDPKRNWLIEVLRDSVTVDMKLFNEIFVQSLIKGIKTDLHEKVVVSNVVFVDMLLTFGTPQTLGILTNFYSTNQIKLFEEDLFSRLLVLPLNQ